MPGTLWSAPVPTLNNNSQVFSPATATLTDITPAQVIINPPQLNVGTRVRLVAHRLLHRDDHGVARSRGVST